MQAKRWVDTDFLTQKEREVNYQRHLQRMQDINHKKRSTSADLFQSQVQQSIMQAKALNSHFNQNERNKEISKENRYLLEKLLQIQEGKQQQHNSPFRSDSIPYQRLLSSRRALELKRYQGAVQICTENRALAKRIVEIKPNFAHDQMMKEIDMYEKMKEKLIKVKINGNKSDLFSSIHNKSLPPISPLEESSQNLKRKRRNKKKRTNLQTDQNSKRNYSFDGTSYLNQDIDKQFLQKPQDTSSANQKQTQNFPDKNNCLPSVGDSTNQEQKMKNSLRAQSVAITRNNNQLN